MFGLRTAIEGVLKKHAQGEYQYLVRDVWEYPSLRISLDALLDDFLACYPQPNMRVVPCSHYGGEGERLIICEAELLRRDLSLECPKHNLPRTCRLCTGTPQPNREALLRVVQRHCVTQPGVPAFRATKEQLTAFLDDLMSWATGKLDKQEKRWCKHMAWRTEDGGYWLYQDTVDNGAGGKQSVRSLEKWAVCPVCETKRPSDE